MIEIYCDGAYSSSRNQGGWAFVVVQNNEVIYKEYDGLLNTTNNRMEILGCLIALEWILKSEKLDFNIYSDSQYVICTLTKGWKKKKNLDMWKRMDLLLEQTKHKNINFIWVRGHDGNKFNEMADIFAVHASHIQGVERDNNYIKE